MSKQNSLIPHHIMVNRYQITNKVIYKIAITHDLNEPAFQTRALRGSKNGV